MKTFDHFNTTGAPCPICGTWDDKPPVLVPINGTESGGNVEALQIHLDCIDWIAYRMHGRLTLYMLSFKEIFGRKLP